jgi:hypothetical protein
VSVNGPCVSISTGTLSPDLRVNYAYGMVLGLGEFLQEQRYLIEKDHLHERALHGFGTVYGLQVTTESVADADYTVTVAPGMCIDQWGREVVVRTPQCARLGAWLAAQQQADPGSVTANLGPSGEHTVYVVASYADCPDDLVPLPGQPCSSAAQTKVASRLRDSWDIQLRWTRPAMPRWDTDRRLARLLSAVQIVAGLDPSQSSEADIISAVQALPDDVGAGPDDLWPLVDWPPTSPPSSPPSGPVVYRLPAETAADALDRIFTVWVTRVRPVLALDLTEPPDTSDPAILLASITFTLGPGGAATGATPPIASCDDPDDHGRPYVLHTRLIQELRALAGGGAATVVGGRELATLTAAADPTGKLTLTAWFHLDAPVSLTAPVAVVTRSGASGTFAPTPVGGPGGGPPQFSDVWTLTAQNNVPAIDGDQVAVSFVPTSVLVGDASTTLAAPMGQGLDLVDTGPGGQVVVYATVRVPGAAPAQQAPPTLEFVTITPLAPATEKLVCELWFHPQPQWPAPRAVITDVKGAVAVFEEQTGQPVAVTTAVRALFDNVWQVELDLTKVVRNAYLRFVFQAPRVPVTVDGKQMNLLVWMKSAGVTFLNRDPAKETITAYCRVAGAQ